MNQQKTTVLKGNQVQRNWHLIDLEGLSWGRASAQIAPLLIGKHKVTYSSHRDDGDYVVAVNASKINITGKKLKQKIYYHHSGYAGNLKELSLAQMMKKDPRQVIYLAVRGMLPKNRRRQDRLARLKIFLGPDHKYGEKFKK
ncbi:50S ribosomal protein L13 [Patescibacteria group bacterium]|nr:50S ribosomal protein L13 [Patescibacteria group bacterium]